MNSDASPDSGIFGPSVVFFCQLYTAVGRVGSLTVSDGEIGFDAVLFRTRQDFAAIGVVALAFEVGVGVDEHGRWSFDEIAWDGRLARPSRVQLGSAISAACRWAHLPENSLAPACRLRATPRRSCRLIPVRAVFGARGSLRSRLCVLLMFPAHTLRRFQRPVVGLRFRDRLPGAAICRRPLRVQRSLLAPRAVLLSRSRRC